jgi:hypothetical protein
MNQTKVRKAIKATQALFDYGEFTNEEVLGVLIFSLVKTLKDTGSDGIQVKGKGFTMNLDLDDDPCPCAKCVAKRAIEKAGA